MIVYKKNHVQYQLVAWSTPKFKRQTTVRHLNMSQLIFLAAKVILKTTKDH